MVEINLNILINTININEPRKELKFRDSYAEQNINCISIYHVPEKQES
jgi:hypothetical protein